MPIIRQRYNPNWDATALAVKTAADWTCQQCGQQCHQAGETWVAFFNRTSWSLASNPKWKHYELTVAHMNQDSSDDAPANLKALCTVCHLRYDRRFWLRNAYSKREWFGQGTVWQLAPRVHLRNESGLEGVQLPLSLEPETRYDGS